MATTYITTAGVYRCCLESVGREYDGKNVKAGDPSICEHCNETFTLVDKQDRLTWIPNWQLKENNAEVVER